MNEYLNNFDVHYLGCIKQDRNMHIAVRQQTPLMMFSPMSTAAVELRRIVSEAFYELPEELKTKEKENEGFFKRLAKIFKGGKTMELDCLHDSRLPVIKNVHMHDPSEIHQIYRRYTCKIDASLL